MKAVTHTHTHSGRDDSCLLGVLSWRQRSKRLEIDPCPSDQVTFSASPGSCQTITSDIFPSFYLWPRVFPP